MKHLTSLLLSALVWSGTYDGHYYCVDYDKDNSLQIRESVIDPKTGNEYFFKVWEDTDPCLCLKIYKMAFSSIIKKAIDKNANKTP